MPAHPATSESQTGLLTPAGQALGSSQQVAFPESSASLSALWRSRPLVISAACSEARKGRSLGLLWVCPPILWPSRVGNWPLGRGKETEPGSEGPPGCNPGWGGWPAVLRRRGRTDLCHQGKVPFQNSLF